MGRDQTNCVASGDPGPTGSPAPGGDDRTKISCQLREHISALFEAAALQLQCKLLTSTQCSLVPSPCQRKYRSHSVPGRKSNVGGHGPTDESAQLIPPVASRNIHHEQPARGHRVVHVAVVLQVPLERLLARRALGAVDVLRACWG
eukprot:scaffold40207_cov43-Phaeocystis_antarctica.AAC.3